MSKKKKNKKNSKCCSATLVFTLIIALAALALSVFNCLKLNCPEFLACGIAKIKTVKCPSVCPCGDDCVEKCGADCVCTNNVESE